MSRKETTHHLGNFYSLVTFIGPQSHLRIHGDADKVTHNYSSMVAPDWANPRLHPKQPCRSVLINSLCPCSTSVHLRMAKKHLCHSQFVFNFWVYSAIKHALWMFQPVLSHLSPLYPPYSYLRKLLLWTITLLLFKTCSLQLNKNRKLNCSTQLSPPTLLMKKKSVSESSISSALLVICPSFKAIFLLIFNKHVDSDLFLNNTSVGSHACPAARFAFKCFSSDLWL